MDGAHSRVFGIILASRNFGEGTPINYQKVVGFMWSVLVGSADVE